MDPSTFFGSEGFPTDAGGIIKYVLICAVALLAIILAVYLIAVVVGLIFRLLFRQIRFVVVFVLSLAAVAAFAALVFFKPITLDENGGTDTLIERVAEKYKGLYPSGVPLIAWRVSDITDEVTQANETQQGEVAENERVYKVSYLPFGELVVRVNPGEGGFTITSGADGQPVTANIKDITDKLIASITRGADKAFTAIGNGMDKSVNAAKDKARELLDETPKPSASPKTSPTPAPSPTEQP